MDLNKMKRQCAEAMAADLIVAYGIPKNDVLEQEQYFRTHKAPRSEILYIQGAAASMLLQDYLDRFDFQFDSPWPREKPPFSEWQWRYFAEILDVFPREFSELFYSMDNSREIDKRQFLTIFQVALQHTFDRLSGKLLG